MEDAGFIIGSYVLTFVMVIGMSWGVVRRGRRLGAQIPDEDKYWT
ncbi:MAG: heme exporter protein CcmD [Ilumatobacteraceae bacterium]|nr:heme exporter protein CcmD [Ilumatobacteraceae bacterium]